MANEMQGMFGQDPALIEQALRQQQDAGIAQQAQMDPWSAVAYGAGTGASRLAGGIGGMLGYEDPQVKQANTIKRVQDESMAEAKAMGIDPAKDMEKFGEIVSNKYNMYGMPDKAFGVQQLIQGMKAQQADIGLKQAKTMAELKKAQTEGSPFGKIDVSKFTPESLKIYMQSGDPSTLQLNPASQSAYNTVVQTDKGLYSFDTRTKEFTPLMVSGGKQAIGAQYSPPLQKSLAESKEAGKVLGEAETTAQIDLPQRLATSQQALQQVDELLAHPGFSTTVGATLLPGMRFVPGTSASDFMARLDQVKGGTFLEAYKTLKGGGQITEIEGKKATDALNAMSISQSEAEFKAAANRYKAIIKAGMERAKRGIVVGKQETQQQEVRKSTKAIPLNDYLTSQGF